MARKQQRQTEEELEQPGLKRKQVKLYEKTAVLLDQIVGFTQETYLDCLHRLVAEELTKRIPEMHEALNRLAKQAHISPHP